MKKFYICAMSLVLLGNVLNCYGGSCFSCCRNPPKDQKEDKETRQGLLAAPINPGQYGALIEEGNVVGDVPEGVPEEDVVFLGREEAGGCESPSKGTVTVIEEREFKQEQEQEQEEDRVVGRITRPRCGIPMSGEDYSSEEGGGCVVGGKTRCEIPRGCASPGVLVHRSVQQRLSWTMQDAKFFCPVALTILKGLAEDGPWFGSFRNYYHEKERDADDKQLLKWLVTLPIQYDEVSVQVDESGRQSRIIVKVYDCSEIFKSVSEGRGRKVVMTLRNDDDYFKVMLCWASIKPKIMDIAKRMQRDGCGVASAIAAIQFIEEYIARAFLYKDKESLVCTVIIGVLPDLEGGDFIGVLGCLKLAPSVYCEGGMLARITTGADCGRACSDPRICVHLLPPGCTNGLLDDSAYRSSCSSGFPMRSLPSSSMSGEDEVGENAYIDS